MEERFVAGYRSTLVTWTEADKVYMRVRDTKGEAVLNLSLKQALDVQRAIAETTGELAARHRFLSD